MIGTHCPTGDQSSISLEPLVQLPTGYGAVLVGLLPAAILWGTSFHWRWQQSRRADKTRGRLVEHLCGDTVGAIIGRLPSACCSYPVGTNVPAAVDRIPAIAGDVCLRAAVPDI